MNRLLVCVVCLASCRGGPTVDVRGESPEARIEALTRVEDDVASRYADVTQLVPDHVATLISNREAVLVDVRETSEFDVARIDGAIRIDPSASAATVESALKESLAGATVIFYCSVGERSSNMASRAQQRLLKAGARSVANLRGGIFAWHNGERALVDAIGPTTAVHPYNDKWGQLLVHRDRMSTAARTNRVAPK